MQAASQPKQKEKKQQEKLPAYVEETRRLKGQKKILQPLDDEYHKAYIPSVVESAWYDWWEKLRVTMSRSSSQNGEVKDKGYFVISIPPPNVTGNLHIGHALATALQDVA